MEYMPEKSLVPITFVQPWLIKQQVFRKVTLFDFSD